MWIDYIRMNLRHFIKIGLNAKKKELENMTSNHSNQMTV